MRSRASRFLRLFLDATTSGQPVSSCAPTNATPGGFIEILEAHISAMLNKLGPGEDAVIPAEIERMYALCEKIVKEKDPQKFLALVSELNHLLAAKERRLEGDAASGRTP